MPVIEINDLKKVYHNAIVPVTAINGVNLAFERGEFTAIVGPSGCGKTTLLNMMGGLDTPTEGKVVIEGEDITKLSPGKLVDFRLNNIGFVFQAYNLIPVLTVRENVEFIMLLQHSNRADIESRVTELLGAMDMGDKIDVRPKYLSGGQQQRVAVARALASHPKFILADEPTANLDSHSAESLLDIMWRMNQKENMTFIFSTHDQRVMDHARRIVTLVDGQVSRDERHISSHETSAASAS
jgi:putative ABC transport system ATP-binding protein